MPVKMNPLLLAYLQELEDLRLPATIRFIGENGGIATVSATISGLQTGGDEPGFWANALRIPLHRLVQVDGFPAQSLT